MWSRSSKAVIIQPQPSHNLSDLQTSLGFVRTVVPISLFGGFRTKVLGTLSWRFPQQSGTCLRMGEPQAHHLVTADSVAAGFVRRRDIGRLNSIKCTKAADNAAGRLEGRQLPTDAAA